MPSQDTWSSQLGLNQASYLGRQRTWTVTPGYGSIPQDEKPVNPYSDYKWDYRQSPITAYSYPVSDPGNITYVYNNSFVLSGSTIGVYWATAVAQSNFVSMASGVPNAVKLKALGKVSDAKVNLAVALAEASKTSDLILGTANRIYKAYRGFRRGNLREIAQNLRIPRPKKLAKSWLEYKYGWMPLLMDVKGAAEFLAQQHITRPQRFTVTAVEKLTKGFSFSDNYTPYGGAPDEVYKRTLFAEYTAKVKLWCEISNPRASELQQLGLTNPALVAWELIPFSFVFDWFISVGDYLTGLTALTGVTVRRGMFSQELTYNYTYTSPGSIRSSGGNVYVISDYSLDTKYREYQRASYSPNPLDLYPPVKSSISFAKLVTGLALIQGNARGLR